MRVQKITLDHFRNYDALEMTFDPKRNIIIGENAQGKTNLIEAVYLCAFARSFRTPNAAELIQFGEEMSTVTAEAVSEDIEKKISISINRSGKKMIKKDGKIIKRTAELLNNLVVVVFSPEDLRIIKDSPDKRRNFINKEISQLRPKYFEALKNYHNVLRQKNSLIKQAGRLRGESVEEMFDIYDYQLAGYGGEVVGMRRAFVELLSERASKIQQHISKGQEVLEIKYRESASKEDFFEIIQKNREKDIEHGYCGNGPHRDDLEFYINGKDARKYGSQGQQRTIALSLKLAEIQIAETILGEPAVLLLDDVLSELDQERQSFLFHEIEDVQLFITTTEVNEDILEKMQGGKVLRIEKGKVI